MADELSSRSLFLTALEAGCMIMLNVLALLGNILVCIAVYRNTKLRTTTNLYIIALAVSDLLSAIFVMPFSAGALIAGRWAFGKKVCEMSGYFTAFVVCVSPVTMGLTAVNRFTRICKSDQQYRRFFSQRKSRILLASAWVFVAFHFILMTFITGLQDFRFVPGYALCLNVHLNKIGTSIHYVVVLGLFFVLPLVVTIFSYRKVFKKIRQHNMGAAQALQPQARISGISSREIRISKSLFVVVFAFMVCWVPLWIVNLLSRFRVAANMPRNVQLICAFCLCLSNAINPFIYAGMNPLFRREFRNILRCRCDRLLQETSQASKESIASRKAQTETTNDDNQGTISQPESCVLTRGDKCPDNEGTELKTIS